MGDHGLDRVMAAEGFDGLGVPGGAIHGSVLDLEALGFEEVRRTELSAV
jgi:hypothetical protein